MSNNSSTKLDLSKPVQTQDGLKARIICTDRKFKEYPIVALVGDHESIVACRADGTSPTGRHLVNVPECLYVLMARHKSGVGLYRSIYDTRKEAEQTQEYLRYHDYTSFDISELTIHI